MAQEKQTGQDTRRQFMKKTAVGGAAIATGLSLARSAHAAGDETIKIGMIGSGGRCSGAAVQSLRSDKGVKLVAMCDVFEDRVRASRNNISRALPDQVDVPDDQMFWDFEGYKKVIEASDVVLIACASKFHPMYAEAAVSAGKHVFVEKPHAIDPVGVRRMEKVCKIAEEKGVSIVSGLQSRYHKGWQATMEQIHNGAIGDIVTMQSTFLRAPYRVYGRDPNLTETEYHFWNWYHFCWLSGDDVTQSLVHNVDRMTWAMQGETPVRCFGLGGRCTSFGEVYGDMFDHHTAVYEYASGARCYAMCRTVSGCYGSSTDYIQGTKGRCALGSCKIEGETNWRYSGPSPSPYDEEQRALIASVRSGELINCGSYMSKSTMMGVLGQIACYQGTMIGWDQAYNAELEFGPSPDVTSFDTPAPTLKDETGNYPLPKPGLTKLV